jgi:hypothetical protein
MAKMLIDGIKSSLTLFMARVLADHAHHVLALHDLATGTKSFN